jgi:hypothetical protein
MRNNAATTRRFAVDDKAMGRWSGSSISQQKLLVAFRLRPASGPADSSHRHLNAGGRLVWTHGWLQSVAAGGVSGRTGL